MHGFVFGEIQCLPGGKKVFIVHHTNILFCDGSNTKLAIFNLKTCQKEFFGILSQLDSIVFKWTFINLRIQSRYFVFGRATIVPLLPPRETMHFIRVIWPQSSQSQLLLRNSYITNRGYYTQRCEDLVKTLL